MPYTNPWDVTRPPGTTPARNIDDEIRALRLDIEERLEDILVKDFSEDPLELQDEFEGKFEDKVVLLAHTAFNGSNTIDWNIDGYLRFGATAVSAPIVLAPTAVIKKVELLVFRALSGTGTLRLRSREFSAGDSTTVHLTTTLGFSVGAFGIGEISGEVTIASNRMYMVELASSQANAFRIYGARITYDTPNFGGLT